MLPQVRRWLRCRAWYPRWLHPRLQLFHLRCSSRPWRMCHLRIWFRRSREHLPLLSCLRCYSSPLRQSPLMLCRPRYLLLRRSQLGLSRRPRGCRLSSKRRHLQSHRSPSHSSSIHRLARSAPARSPNRRKEGRPMRTNLRSLSGACPHVTGPYKGGEGGLRATRGPALRGAYQPMATRMYCGFLCEMYDDQLPTSSYGKPYAFPLWAWSCQNLA